MNIPALAHTATNPNVFIHDGKVVTTSQAVSECFHKLHKNVIQKIESLDCSPEFTSANFSAHVENIKAGAVNRDSKYYEMTKDGFVFLVMGFTGKKAAAFKEAYIGEFNRMEAELFGHIQPHNSSAPTYNITLTERELNHLCWLWKVADNMRKGAEEMHPGLKALGSEFSGRCYDIAFESRYTLDEVKKILCRETQQVDPLTYQWRYILPQLHQVKH